MRKSHAGRMVNQIPRTQHDNPYGHVYFNFSMDGFAGNICQDIPSAICCKRPPRGFDKLLKRYRRRVTHSHTCICRYVFSTTPQHYQ